MLVAIVGVNWGDEGKGRMVDLLSDEYDVVVRYQGGNNAGHTVVNEKGKFILNLLPSGILREKTINVMGQGMVIDVEHLFHEVEHLRQSGINISPQNLKISDQATICLPFNKLLDELEEDRLGANKFGSTRRGIAPVYSDKYMKKALRMGDLKDFVKLKSKLPSLVEWKNLLIEKGYGHAPIKVDELAKWLEQFGLYFLPYIIDTTAFLSSMIKENKSLMFEAQLGALRDIDYGIYPFTSSSNTIASYAPIGSGIPFAHLDETLGIMKAYSTCVGAGPFVAEMFDQEGDNLREAGHEYGAATGRPRRVGGFDIVASRYGVLIQGATAIALTKLDVLSGLKRIPVVVAYEVDGKRIDFFPKGEELERAKPIYEYLPGFKEDISKARRLEDLPLAAINYIRYLEKAVACPIQYVSVGPSREEYIKLF